MATEETTDFELDLDSIVESEAPRRSAGAVEKRITDSLSEQGGPQIGAFGNITLECRSLLSPQQRENVAAKAREEYDNLLTDRTYRGRFGNTALDSLNGAVNNLLAQRENFKVPEITGPIRELEHAMDGFNHNYAVDSKAATAVRQLGTRVKDLFTVFRQMGLDYYRDSQSLLERFDGITGRLMKMKLQLEANVTSCSLLYETNEKSIIRLIGVIAIMEEVAELGADNLAKLQAERSQHAPGTPDYQKLSGPIEQTELLVKDFKTRSSEFMQRLYVAWATGPQIIKIQDISYGLAQRLGLLANLTIPTMRLTVALMGTLDEACRAAEVTQATYELNNKILSNFAKTSGAVVAQAAAVIQQPSTSPLVMLELAQSIAGQNKSLAAAFEKGEALRAEASRAMAQGAIVIANSERERGEAMLAAIAASRDTVNLGEIPPVPSAVAAYGKQIAK